MTHRPVTFTNVERIERGHRKRLNDLVAVEEPLQIILEYGEAHARCEAPLALTMRTPGNDHDLVTGFLYSEGVIGGIGDVVRMGRCARSETPGNVLRAVLHEGAVVPERLLERKLTVTSACGVCGERTLQALEKGGCDRLAMRTGLFRPQSILRAVGSLEGSQAWFRHTGGTHGAALFDVDGELLMHREDVGRHNALDKLIGAWLRDAKLTAARCFVLLTSRASFELVQKTIRARFPMLVAMGAASSLAAQTAARFDLTLAGFAKEDRFNVYSAGGRIIREARDTVFVELGAT